MVKPGDIVEVETPKGLAYLQVTHEHPSYPPAIRGLPGLHATRPERPETLADAPTAFVALVPLDSALTALGVRFEVVGTAPVASGDFPVFRMPVRGKAGEILYWWFWDGRGLRYASDPDGEDAQAPLRTVIGGRELMRLLTGADDDAAGR